MSQIDKLFEQNQVGSGEFAFDENVARVFDDMIIRSVPLYREVQQLIPRLANMLDHEIIKVVDLGCSTGTSLIQLSKNLFDRKMELVGVDNSDAMLDKCREKIGQHSVAHEVTLVESDIFDFAFEDTSIVLMNYTLQFVSVESRPQLLHRICQSIRPGGFLLLSEKFAHYDAEMDHELFEFYVDYKRRNGYSELEIARKRDALENVLIPLSACDNEKLLTEAGFDDVELLLKWFNFGTFLARVV